MTEGILTHDTKRTMKKMSENTIALRIQKKAYKVWVNNYTYFYTDSVDLAYSFDKEVLIVPYDWTNTREVNMKNINTKLLQQIEGAENKEEITLTEDTAPLFKKMAQDLCEHDGCYWWHPKHSPRCTRHFLPKMRNRLSMTTVQQERKRA